MDTKALETLAALIAAAVKDDRAATLEIFEERNAQLARALQSRRVVGRPHTDLVNLQAANQVTPIVRKGPRWCVDALIIAGPRADGTPNADTIFLGGDNVQAGHGYPLEPGAFVALSDLGIFDLSCVYIIGATATDVVRVMYFLKDDEQ